MAVFSQQTHIPAPLREVFDFHCNVENIGRVQPPGIRAEIQTTKPVLEQGDVVDLKVTQWGVHHHWRIRVDRLVCRKDNKRALLLDRALHSPFSFWLHRHEFFSEGQITRMRDVVDFEVVPGWLGWLAAIPVWLTFCIVFSVRHNRTRNFFRNKGKLQ